LIHKALAVAHQIFTVTLAVDLSGISIGAGFRPVRQELPSSMGAYEVDATLQEPPVAGQAAITR
jgi:hypothetical protein